MRPDDLRELLTPEGLRLLDELGPLERGADVLRLVTRLRGEGHPPGRVAAVLEQARLRTRARAKFGEFAGRMLFTPEGLEQATRLPVAAIHAGRFAEAGIRSFADLGCGIGADAMAFAALEFDVLAVEQDETTAAVAAYNLAPFPTARVEHADAAAADLSAVEGVWLDPSRRTQGRRSHDPADWSPPLDWALGLLERMPGGVKLAPGLDREFIPGDTEAQWVSADGEVVELVVWGPRLARPGVGRAALVLGPGGAAEITAPADSPDAETGELGGYLLEPDGAVIRARLIGELARRTDGRMLDRSIAWITTDERPATPFGAAFRVIERLPLDVPKLSRELSSRGIGELEIKKRGVDVDPARLRTQLKLSGEGRATLVLTRIAGKRVAILAERC